VTGIPDWRRTEHPGGLRAESRSDDDLVTLSISDALDMTIEKDVLRAIVAEHCDMRTVGDWRDWLTPTEQKRLEHGIAPHPFEPGYSGMACIHMVMRADYGEDCGLPGRSKVHDDPNEGLDFDEERRL
jgi:hypothetical protein